MGAEHARSGRSPWAFVPSLYFLQGVPYFVVETVTTTYFAALKVPIESIGHWSSSLALPWTLKPLWSPLVDLHATKRAWIVWMQILVAAGLAFLAFAVTRSDAVMWCVAACATIALASATHDVACDGWYLLALDEPRQAAFVGVRSACFRLGRIFVTGGLVYLAGTLQTATGHPLALGLPVGEAWAIAFLAGLGVYALGLAWGAVVMPRVEVGPRPAAASARAPTFARAVSTYFRQPGIVGIVAFILLYRVGESMLTRMSSPFLLKPRSEGGLGLTTAEVGLYAGTIGVGALVLGGVLGGFLIARFGLRRSLWPMVIAMHAPNALYAWAAFTQPGEAAVAAVIAVEQLGYGIGFSAYMVVLMVVSRGGPFATTHYAISTGLMALSAQAAGYVSGDLAAWLGFPWFFVLVCALGIPGMITLFFVPTSTREEQAISP